MVAKTATYDPIPNTKITSFVRGHTGAWPGHRRHLPAASADDALSVGGGCLFCAQLGEDVPMAHGPPLVRPFDQELSPSQGHHQTK